jgi:hypothetical protein
MESRYVTAGVGLALLLGVTPSWAAKDAGLGHD